MKTRNILIATVSAAAITAMASAACAAGSVSATAPASVTVLSPATITKTQDLVFGQVVRPSNASTNTVVLDADNVVTMTGSGNGSIVASTTRSAKFNVAAAAGVTYSTTQALTFTQTGLTNIAPSLPTTTAGTPGLIPVGGIQEIRYGGQFDMTASTPAQNYTGTLSVTVNYN
jgi:spore coat protein U-like protein